MKVCSRKSNVNFNHRTQLIDQSNKRNLLYLEKKTRKKKSESTINVLFALSKRLASSIITI